MKKLIAALLTLALLAGIVPAALGAMTASAAQPKSIKVLSIGEDFNRIGFDYLYRVLKAEGYSDVKVAYLHGYQSDDSLTGYVAGLAEDKESYAFDLNVRDFLDFSLRYSVREAIVKEDWDYIVLGTDPIQSGQESEFAAALDTMIAYINEHKTNPNAKIGWNMNWAYQDGYENEQFKSVYEGKQDTMYAAIAKAAEQVEKKVDFVLPIGTAIMNMKSSYMGDVQVDEGELVVDGANLNELGKLITSYTWYAKLSGNKLTNLNYTDAFFVNLSSADRKVVMEAINNAIKTPYAATESSYKTEPVQYDAIVNGTTYRSLPGDIITVETKAALNAGRKFLNWSAVKGEVKFADAAAQTTTFKMPAQDVEVKAVYEAEDEVPGQLKVGFGRADVTPDQPVFMWGYSDWNTRQSTGLLSEEDRITITAIAVSDGNETNIMITMDFLYVPKNWDDFARAEVEKQLGFPGERLAFSATHTHSSVACGENYALSSSSWYYPIWMNGMLSAVETALNDLSPVSASKISVTEVPGMNWRRHWRFEDGTIDGVNFAKMKTPDKTSGQQGHLDDSDRELQVVRFVRDDKKDVVMVNWQAHPVLASSNTFGNAHYTELSADFPGYMRNYVEAQDEDTQVAFFQGAAGNVQHRALIIGWYLNPKWNAPAQPEPYGDKLGGYVIEAMKNMTTVEHGAVHGVVQEQTMYKRDLSETEVWLDAVSVGNSIAFVTAPCEMFDTHAKYVKGNSPFEVTFNMTCGRYTQLQYVPDWATYFYPVLGGEVAYEAGSNTGRMAPGTGEDLADALVGLLNVLYQK